MRSLEYSWKYKNYELRAVPERLARFEPNEPNTTIALVKWQEDRSSCFTLGYWKKQSENYDFHFVGSRMFRYIDKVDLDIVWGQLDIAQEVLQEFEFRTSFEEENE